MRKNPRFQPWDKSILKNQKKSFLFLFFQHTINVNKAVQILTVSDEKNQVFRSQINGRAVKSIYVVLHMLKYETLTKAAKVHGRNVMQNLHQQMEN